MTTTDTTSPVYAATDLPTVGHWIDGADYPSRSGRTADVYDPALGVVTKRVALADGAEIEAAIGRASCRERVCWIV